MRFRSLALLKRTLFQLAACPVVFGFVDITRGECVLDLDELFCATLPVQWFPARRCAMLRMRMDTTGPEHGRRDEQQGHQRPARRPESGRQSRAGSLREAMVRRRAKRGRGWLVVIERGGCRV